MKVCTYVIYFQCLEVVLANFYQKSIYLMPIQMVNIAEI